jgi:hypothetical protein
MRIGIGTLVRVKTPNKLLQGKVGYVVAEDLYPKENRRWFSVCLFGTQYGNNPMDFHQQELEIIP